VRRRISRFRRSCGFVGPDLAPDLLGERGEREHVGAGGVEVFGHLRELLGEGVQDPIVLRGNGFRVRLVMDRVQQGLDPRPAGLGADAGQVDRVVGAAALPGRTGQGRPDRGDQPGVGIGGDQLDPGQAAGGEAAEEGQPASAVLAAGDVQAEDLPVPVGVDPGREQGVNVDHPPSLADLEHQASAATNV
jgi:hypothetical protein